VELRYVDPPAGVSGPAQLQVDIFDRGTHQDSTGFDATAFTEHDISWRIENLTPDTQADPDNAGWQNQFSFEMAAEPDRAAVYAQELTGDDPADQADAATDTESAGTGTAVEAGADPETADSPDTENKAPATGPPVDSTESGDVEAGDLLGQLFIGQFRKALDEFVDDPAGMPLSDLVDAARTVLADPEADWRITIRRFPSRSERRRSRTSECGICSAGWWMRAVICFTRTRSKTSAR
jgi:hypothetical protein